ncbi:MAG: NADPH-dependent FMN reductase [Ponticaulis sp.]|nr:NADPH-dependent FMN reductase [Ponticaulis sp.]
MQTLPCIAIIVGSTRPGRNSEAVADWLFRIAETRTDTEFELIDLCEVDLPFLDEPVSARAAANMKIEYSHPHTQNWSETVKRYDGFVFVVPEYNRSIPAVLKNALDYLYSEWANKPAGIVSYGAQGGARASAQLRLILGELHMPTVATELNLMLYTDFQDFTFFAPAEVHSKTADTLLNQVAEWTLALRALRAA